MRRVPFQRISNFVGQYQDNSTLINPSQPPLSFRSQPDEKWVFANYTQRYLDGQVAGIPSIIGTTAREGSALAYVPLADYAAGPSEEAVVKGTVRFVCPAHASSAARDGLGSPRTATTGRATSPTWPGPCRGWARTTTRWRGLAIFRTWNTILGLEQTFSLNTEALGVGVCI